MDKSHIYWSGGNILYLLTLFDKGINAVRVALWKSNSLLRKNVTQQYISDFYITKPFSKSVFKWHDYHQMINKDWNNQVLEPPVTKQPTSTRINNDWIASSWLTTHLEGKQCLCTISHTTDISLMMGFFKFFNQSDFHFIMAFCMDKPIAT